MEQLIGQTIGQQNDKNNGQRYHIKRILGQQTGRRTFLATQQSTDRLVVIKLMLFGPDFTWEDLKLFEREAETLKSLDHPAIPKYLDSFEVETPLGKGFALVQTYIPAKTLEAWVRSGREFAEPDLQPIAKALLSILYYLHSCYPAVIHRDIKPSNILLSEASKTAPAKLYLVDFGSVQTAKKDGTMTVVGTYGYMPPEQFSGRAQPASDLYSLGATLIYLATSKHPAELTQDNLTIEFTPHVSFSASFAQWLTRLTAPQLAQRISSARQALRQLTHPQAAVPESAVAANPTVAYGALSVATSAYDIVQTNQNDIDVVATSEALEIKCLRSHIREPLRARESAGLLIESGDYRFRYCAFFIGALSTGFWLMTLKIIFLSQFGLLLFCAGLLSLFIPIHWMPHPEQDRNQQVSLKLYHRGSDTFIGLSTLVEEGRAGSIIHFEEIPLHNVKKRSNRFTQQGELIFTTFQQFNFGCLQRKRYTGPKYHRRAVYYPTAQSCLRFVGSQQEISWISSHITQWRAQH